MMLEAGTVAVLILGALAIGVVWGYLGGRG